MLDEPICASCGYRLQAPAIITRAEFRDDGVPFLTMLMYCPECRWPNIFGEYFGRTVWVAKAAEHTFAS